MLIVIFLLNIVFSNGEENNYGLVHYELGFDSQSSEILYKFSTEEGSQESTKDLFWTLPPQYLGSKVIDLIYISSKIIYVIAISF